MKGLIRPKAKRAWKKASQISRLGLYLSAIKEGQPFQGDLGILFRKGKFYDVFERVNRKKIFREEKKI